MKKKELLDSAFTKFEKEEYTQALETFVEVYQMGYEREHVLEIIYSNYVKKQEQVFQNNFEICMQYNKNAYEQCILDFVPYKEGEYFIFDKEKKSFEGIFSIKDLCDAEPDLIFSQNESGDVVIQCDWDYRDMINILSGARGRKVYIVPCDFGRAISFCKIPEFTAFFSDIKVFMDEQEYQSYFHKNTEIYLPKLVFAEDEDCANRIETVYNEEHAYRLTREGRNDKAVLLTIGIPTHNRGNLLLKRIEHLKNMPYDAEIEVVISKNGSALYQEEYKKASETEDARFVYYGTDEELKAHHNWYNVVKQAHGKYILFVSDEDDVVIEALDHYLKLLSASENLGQIRAKTNSQYVRLVKEYGKMGRDAFEKVFLRQNYLSSLIVNREKFLQADLLRYDKYQDNIFYQNYPHEWWCAALAELGDCLREPVLLVEEKEAALNDECEQYEKLGIMKKTAAFDENCGIPKYATYESRFEQFCGQIEFLKIYAANDSLAAWSGLVISIHKLALLLNVARTWHYKEEFYQNVIDEFARITMEAMDQFEFDDRQQLGILLKIKKDSEYLISKGSQQNK